LDDTSIHPPIRSYVLRQAKISRAQKEAYEKYAPFYLLPYDPEKSVFDYFPKDEPLVVEIGFGMGHTTVEIAKSNPSVHYLGLEVHTPGVGALFARIHADKLKNLNVIKRDAIEVFSTMIPRESINGVHLFFPDPWQKKKHHKRRIFQQSFLELVFEKLRPGGYLYAVTDWEDYAQQMLEYSRDFGKFKNSGDGFINPKSWRPMTSFERKGKAKNHEIYELYFEKPDGPLM